MKIKCITISRTKKIPIFDEVTIKDDNMLCLNSLPESELNAMELSKDNKRLIFTELEPYIYAVSTNALFFSEYDREANDYEYSIDCKNIKIRDKQLWGDVVILKIINEKVYGLTTDEIDKYIMEIKDL